MNIMVTILVLKRLIQIHTLLQIRIQLIPTLQIHTIEIHTHLLIHILQIHTIEVHTLLTLLTPLTL